MKLSDIMGHANLALYAEIALALFFLVFVAVVVRTYLPGRRATLERGALLPLDDPNDRLGRTLPGAAARPD